LSISTYRNQIKIIFLNALEMSGVVTFNVYVRYRENMRVSKIRKWHNKLQNTFTETYYIQNRVVDMVR